ncbi:hypothetical protein [Pectobacterium parvum]|uniref:hypothetical protein n=1 Tax=Pectobacterium parvum TaxID=2778550 RepID=UPI00381CCCE8
MPDLELMPLKNIEFYKTAEKIIFEDYQCNCKKGWKDEDRFIVYKADKSGITEVINNNINENNLNTLLELSPHYLSEKIIISGGHTVVNLNDRFSVSPEVERSAKFCIDYIIKSIKKFKIKPDFLMEINDFYMEKSDGSEIGKENHFRKIATSPYIIPERINRYIKDSCMKNKTDITSFYVSEKNMADRFKRHIKNQKNNVLFKKINETLYMNVGGEEFEVIKNNKPTCVAGNAATFRAIRYRISPNKTADNYTSHIGVFPLCSKQNVLNGYRAASAFYDDFELPSLLVFFGKSCFQ